MLARSSGCAKAVPHTFTRAFSVTMAQKHVKRITIFKVPEQHIDAVLKEYEVLRKNAKRNGEPYIVSNVARKVLNTGSPLSDGYTIVSQSIFKDHSDHDFYDKECEAHKELKKTTGKVKTGIMTVVTEGDWPEPKL